MSLPVGKRVFAASEIYFKLLDIIVVLLDRRGISTGREYSPCPFVLFSVLGSAHFLSNKQSVLSLTLKRSDSAIFSLVVFLLPRRIIQVHLCLCHLLTALE